MESRSTEVRDESPSLASPPRPGLSIVVPAWNAEDTIGASIRSCLDQEEPALEVIVADDGSADETAERAEAAGATVLRLTVRRGPGGARNAGVRAARGEVILFVDSDVIAPPDLTRRMAARLAADPGLTGVIGAYTPDTPTAGVVTRFKNLQHHWVHRRNGGPVSTFWCGCGAIRRSSLEAVGGFVEADPEEVLEDVELGYRITGSGGRIELDPEIRVTHLRPYSLVGLIRSDLTRRAIPWTRTLLARGEKRRDLNLRTGGVLGALLAPATSLLLVLGFLWTPAWWGALGCLAVVLAMDAPFLAFLARNLGPLGAVPGILLQLIYHHVCAFGFGFGLMRHLLSRRARRERAESGDPGRRAAVR